MITLHPDIKNRVEAWQRELRELTGDEKLLLFAIHQPKRAVPIEYIIKVVCEETDFPQVRLPIKSRERESVLTRHLIAFFARIYTRLSLKKIGRFIGRVDHTTVVHASERIKELIEIGDTRVVSLVFEIEKRIEEYANQK